MFSPIAPSPRPLKARPPLRSWQRWSLRALRKPWTPFQQLVFFSRHILRPFLSDNMGLDTGAKRYLRLPLIEPVKLLTKHICQQGHFQTRMQSSPGHSAGAAFASLRDHHQTIQAVDNVRRRLTKQCIVRLRASISGIEVVTHLGRVPCDVVEFVARRCTKRCARDRSDRR